MALRRQINSKPISHPGLSTDSVLFKDKNVANMNCVGFSKHQCGGTLAPVVGIAMIFMNKVKNFS